MIDNCKEEMNMVIVESQLDCLVLKIKSRVIKSQFYQFKSWNAKKAKPRENKAKTRRLRDETCTKKGSKSHFGYKVHRIIDRNYELIRRFKTTIASFYDSYVDLSEQNEMVYRGAEDTLEQNQKIIIQQ